MTAAISTSGALYMWGGPGLGLGSPQLRLLPTIHQPLAAARLHTLLVALGGGHVVVACTLEPPSASLAFPTAPATAAPPPLPPPVEMTIEPEGGVVLPGEQLIVHWRRAVAAADEQIFVLGEADRGGKIKQSDHVAIEADGTVGRVCSSVCGCDERARRRGLRHLGMHSRRMLAPIALCRLADD